MAETTYPLSRTTFRVEIEKIGDDMPGWVRVGGLSLETFTSPIFPSHTDRPRNLPGKSVAGPVELHRMFDGDRRLFEWAQRQARDKRNGSVIFLDYTKEEKLRINWTGGWVSRYELPDFNAEEGSEGMAKEIIVITVEDLFLG